MVHVVRFFPSFKELEPSAQDLEIGNNCIVLVTNGKSWLVSFLKVTVSTLELVHY